LLHVSVCVSLCDLNSCPICVLHQLGTRSPRIAGHATTAAVQVHFMQPRQHVQALCPALSRVSSAYPPGWRAFGRGGSQGPGDGVHSHSFHDCQCAHHHSERLETTCIRCQPGSALGVVQVETLIQCEFEQNMCETLLAGHTVWRCCRKIRRLHQPSVTAECLRSATRPLAR
jgi:hypothetical protein